MNVLILKDKDQFDRMLDSADGMRKIHLAHFVAYAYGNAFSIVKDRYENRAGSFVTPAMLSNILAQE